MRPHGLRLTGRQIAALVVLLACAALLGVIGYRLANPGAASTVVGATRINESGQAAAVSPYRATDFELRGFDRRTYDLGRLRGKVVVVNFWSSTCPPCEEEAPVLERAWNRYRDRGVVLLGVDVWESDATAREFVQSHGITYPNGTARSTLAAEYGLTGIPETFVVDRHGYVVRHWIGPLSQRQANRLIEGVLSSDRS